jgi:endonuclease/exonuclease/phosphatase family metal-dependent hydrolase
MPDGYRTQVRLVTFNILHGRSPERDEVDIETFAATIASLDADVLALQEVDRNQTRSKRADLTAVAAEAMGADHHLFVAALSGSPGATWTAATGKEQPDAAAYGIALLSRCPATSWEVVRLPVVPGPAPMRFYGHRWPTLVREEPRVAVAACVDSPLGPLTVATTHLSFLPWWNGYQLRKLVRALRASPRPLLLTGDLNMDTAKAVRITGMEPLGGRQPTFPVQDPNVQLDHVLAGGFTGTAKASVRRLPVSDHLALVVDLEAWGWPR